MMIILEIEVNSTTSKAIAELQENMTHFYKYKLLSEISDVPDDIGGIYSFYLRFPTDYELGIIEGRAIDVNKTGRLITLKLNQFSSILSDRNYSGFIRDESALHLRKHYSLLANRKNLVTATDLIEPLIEGVSLDNLKQTTHAVRTFLEHTGPIYVGMSIDQSFRERLSQHVNGETIFSKELESANIGFSSLCVACLPLSNVDRDKTRATEKLLQWLLKPTLSKC